MYKFDFAFFAHELLTGFTYIPITLLLAITPLIVGVTFGFLLAVCRIQKIKVLDKLVQIYVRVFRSLPLVLVIVILFYLFQYGFLALSNALNLGLNAGDIPPLLFAIVILSVIAMAYVSESIRMALQSVQKGQIEAASSIGMTTPMIYRRVIIPQALPVAVPILGNTFIGLTKGTALAYMLGVTDLVTGVKVEATASFRYLEAYIVIAIIYWGLCIAIERGVTFFSVRVNAYDTISEGARLD